MEERSVLKKATKAVKVSQRTNKIDHLSGQAQTVQFQKLLDALPVAVILVNLRGRIQFMNRMAKDLLGEPSKRLKLEEWPQHFGFYLDDGKILYPWEKLALAGALNGKAVDESEEIVLRKDGEQRGIWISISTELLRDDNGEITGGIALLRKINYRKQIELSREKYIQQVEALYKLSHILAEAGTDLKETVLLAASFPAEVIGGMGVVTLVNSSKDKLQIAAFHDTDSTRQALLRKFLVLDTEYDFSEGLAGGVVRTGEPLLVPSIPPEQFQAISLPAFKDIIAEAHLSSVLIVPLVGRSGVLGAINLFRPSDAKPFSSGDQSFLVDICHRVALAIENCRLFESLREEISRRLSTKQALEVSEERFHSIFESVTLGIKVLDQDGSILQTNPAFQEMLGYREEELTGRHFHNFLHPDDITQALRLFVDVKNKGVSSFHFEHRTLHKDGSTVWAKTLFTIVKKSGEDGGPAFIVGIVENITEQKRLELEMTELTDRLQNSMELERLRLAQELHDNPMQALYSANYRLEELRTKADPQLNKALLEVKNIIQDVLQDLRTTAKELRPPTIFSFGLENAIRSHVHDFQEQHPEIKVSLSLAHDRQMLPDKVRLTLFRVLQQSLANIIRHAQATEVRVRFLFDAEEAHLEVSDNGKGFEVPHHLIELVRQEHYGLAGASERVSALGGILNVESQPGKFTTVRAIIPFLLEETDN